jgi:membrane-bound ClpP family serine protease
VAHFHGGRRQTRANVEVMTVLGIVVLVVGVILLAVEAHVPTAGLIGSLGVAALIAGAALAVVGAGGGPWLALGVAGGTAFLAGAGLVTVVRRVGAVRRALPRGGASGLVGHVAIVRSWSGDEGRVFVDGALWKARDGLGESIEEGDEMVVDHVHGLTLRVRKAEPWELDR